MVLFLLMIEMINMLYLLSDLNLYLSKIEIIDILNYIDRSIVDEESFRGLVSESGGAFC